MFLGITRVGSLSVADAEVEQPSISGRPVDDRVDSLISRIRPARHSEQRRYRVAQYVSSLITRSFSVDHEVEAFMFGSVPLKTYLPDGDIDLSVFQSRGNSLRDTWTTKLCSVLEDEQRDPYASFRVRDVQVIHAEVKLLKCLVDNIVVDISFETLGGLCTVAFLESIDRHIQGDHIFKRSVILVKAWCYYESRLLGAHHGLISTYALETMVLYIFNIHHKELQSPCQVLHKFLEVFSQFDWDKYCLSLRGPIILSSFPDPQVEDPPEVQKDNLLLNEDFTDEMMEMYSPARQKSRPDSKPVVAPANRSFPVKFLNIMDPLLPTNNLGRSVNKASFARIRKAFAHGAQSLTTIVAKDEKDAVAAIDKFFKNTWNAQRPMPKPSQQSTPLQPATSWQGNKPMQGYGSPVINIPPEHLQYWQQYQQQRMLQHLQQHHQHYQQQVQHAAKHQQRGEQHALPASSHAQYNMQQLQQQPSQPQRPAAMPTGSGHADPPARVASPFASHARTDSSDTFLQPGSPDAAGQILHAVPGADLAAHAAAPDLQGQPEPQGPEEALHDRPGQPQEELQAAASAQSLPAQQPQHPSVNPPDGLPADMCSLPVSSPHAPQAALPCSIPPSSATAVGPVSAAAATPAADGVTAVQASGASPVAPSNLAASPASSSHGVPAPHLQQLPASLMASMGYPLQGYGLPMQAVNGRDMFQYGGMMIPLMPPGMMLPPPLQQQQHHVNRAGRSSRGGVSAANSSGNANGKWGSVAGQQQAALEQLFPDMRPQLIQQPAYQQRQDQQLQHQQPPHLPAQVPDDILAGDIEQLNEHLHTARVCHVHKAAAAHISSSQHPASDPPPASLPNPPIHGGQQQTGQPRRPDANGLALLADRSRPKERHDRWPGSNGVYAAGRMAQSNSPPMTPAYPQNHAVPVPPHLLQQQFPGQVFLPPTREMRQAHQQQQHQQRQGYWHPHPQQHPAMPPWQPQPPRSSSVDGLQSRSSAAVGSAASPALPQPPPVLTPQPQQEPPPMQAALQASQSQLLQAPTGSGDAGWQGHVSSSPALVGSHAPLHVSNGVMASTRVHGPASVDSPPAPKGIWGDGLHQQRLTNLANDLVAVRVAPADTTAAEAPAAFGISNRREAPPSSSRSAGSTPHAGEAQRARGSNFPFDGQRSRGNSFPFDVAAAVNKQRRDRLPHNASAHELGQTGSSGVGPSEAPPRRDRAAKLSLDSLTSQAEAAQRQQAMAGFALNTEDFPALGGLTPGPSIVASPQLAGGGKRANSNSASVGKAWSETDALSPPVHKSPPG